MKDITDWRPQSSEENSSNSEASYGFSSNFTDEIENLHRKLRSSPSVSSPDHGEFIRSVGEDIDSSLGRLTVLLTGNKNSSERGGSAEAVREVIDDAIINDEIETYDSADEFISDFKEYANSEAFDLTSPRTSRHVPRFLEEDVEIVLSFLQKYGNEEEILGEEHLTYTLEQHQPVLDGDVEDARGSEYKMVTWESGFDINLPKLYEHGVIGKKREGARKGDVEIAVQKDRIEDYL